MKKIIMILLISLIGIGFTSCKKEPIEPFQNSSNDNITSPIEDMGDYVDSKQMYIEFYNAPTTVFSLNLKIYAKYKDTTIILPFENNRNFMYYQLPLGFEFVIKTDYFNDIGVPDDKIKMRLNYNGYDHYREHTVVENNHNYGIKNEFLWTFDFKTGDELSNYN